MKKKPKIPDRRFRHRHKMFLLLLSGALLFQWGKIDAFAAAKEIKTVNIRVTSKLEAGSKLPDIKLETTTVSDGEVAVDAGGSKYSVSEAEWTDKSSNELKASEEPQMKVTLEPEDVSEDYFVSSYKKANVKISGGTFVSARRDGDDLVVTLRVNGIKGDYAAPEDAWWNEKSLGQAKWEKPDNTSGYYEVQLYRGKSKVYSVSQTSAVQYNFYPYMTKTGEYTFKVRTVPGTDSQKKYGGKSEWIESGELSITDRYVSDGKGQQSKNPSAKSGTTKKTMYGITDFRMALYAGVHGSRSTDTGIILMLMARCLQAGRRQQITGIICMIPGKWRPDGQRSMVSGIISGHLRKMGIHREPWLMEAGRS